MQTKPLSGRDPVLKILGSGDKAPKEFPFGFQQLKTRHRKIMTGLNPHNCNVEKIEKAQEDLDSSIDSDFYKEEDEANPTPTNGG